MWWTYNGLYRGMVGELRLAQILLGHDDDVRLIIFRKASVSRVGKVNPTAVGVWPFGTVAWSTGGARRKTVGASVQEKLLQRRKGGDEDAE